RQSARRGRSGAAGLPVGNRGEGPVNPKRAVRLEDRRSAEGAGRVDRELYESDDSPGNGQSPVAVPPWPRAGSNGQRLWVWRQAANASGAFGLVGERAGRGRLAPEADS